MASGRVKEIFTSMCRDDMRKRDDCNVVGIGIGRRKVGSGIKPRAADEVVTRATPVVIAASTSDFQPDSKQPRENHRAEPLGAVKEEQVIAILVKDKKRCCPQLAVILGSPLTEVIEVGEVVALPKTDPPRETWGIP